MRFFHGTSAPLETNYILEGRGDSYESDWGHTDFYQVLEKYRPPGFLSHKEAVFLCHHPDHIDAAGGNTDYICEMKVLGSIDRHDMNWSSQISILMSEGHTDSQEIQECAYNYWHGVPHPDDNMWEYLTQKVIVLSCAPFEDAFIDEHIRENIHDSQFNAFKEHLNFEKNLENPSSKHKMKM